MALETIDVPQADSLALVRRVVHVLRESPHAEIKDLAATCQFSERHVRYRLQAARVLGFVAEENEGFEVTARGSRLLATEPNSPAEKNEIRRAISASPIMKQLAPNLLDTKELNVDAVATRIARVSGLSRSTAERRAVGFRSWHRYLCEF